MASPSQGSEVVSTAKDPKRVAAGKRAWAKLSPAKKAAVKARLKRVRPNKGGGGSKTAKKANPGRAVTTTGTTAMTKPKPPKIGASYSAAKATVFVFSPLIDESVGQDAVGKDPAVILMAAGRKVWSLPYAYNLGVVAADAGIDRKTAHATAMSKGSLSAWLPEAYLAFGVAKPIVERGGPPRAVTRLLHERVVNAHQGYDPRRNAISLTSDFKIYRALRHGGQFFRRIQGRMGIFKRVFRGPKAFLKMLGGRV